MKTRLEYLDIVRALSVSLVIYGHFVSVASGAPEIPLVVGSGTDLPVIQTPWVMQRFDVILSRWAHTQSAVLGVTLFFITTGYLIPMMMERYSRPAFLANRFLRIFPVLFVGCGIVAGLVTTQGISTSLASFLASITLTYLFVAVAPVIGVLWTLVTEVIFYLVSSIIGRWTLTKFIAFEAALFAATMLAGISTSHLSTTVIYETKPLFLICIGCAIYLAEKHGQFLITLGGIVAAYAGLQLVHWTGKFPDSSYETLGNLLVASVLFLGLKHLAPRCPRWLSGYADLVYPIYVIHVPVGILTMLLVRETSTNPYVLLASAVIAVIAMSIVLHRFVERPFIALGRTFLQPG